MPLKRHWRKLLFFPPVLIGIALLIWFARSGEEPVQTPPEETTRLVRVISAPAVDLVPRVLGYGNVEPGRVWEAVAEVSGRIIEKHPRLESGDLMTAGEVILRIDAARYELAVERVRAQIRGAEAQITELGVREESTVRSLDIERRALGLVEKDLTRKQTLLKRGSISQAAVDEAERAVLSLRQAVQVQQSALDLIPAQREVLQANLALYKTEFGQAELNLARTEIVAPFEARVAAVNVEEQQFVGAGQVMAVLDGIDVAEVAAQIPIDKVRRLFAATRLEAQDITPENLGRTFERLGLEAVVRMSLGDVRAEWPARFARVRETVDPNTRAIGIVVAVDQPYRLTEVGRKPPLVRNMYVEVELRGQPVSDKVVIPRSAIHDGIVYVLAEGNRLQRRPLMIGMRQGGFVTVDEGLAAGEIVVVSDLSPAIDGMLLAPQEDSEVQARLIAEATGKGSVR